MLESYAYRVKRLESKSIIDDAIKLRASAGFRQQSPISASQFLETYSQLLAKHSGENSSVFYIDDSGKMSALAYFDPTQNLMQFRDDIWMSAERGDIEGEYTVAHELGHFKYHHIPLYFRLEAYSQQEASQIPAEEHSEEQADLFACALSLPPKHLQRLLNKGVTLRYVSLRYKIPELNLERYIERLVSECGYDIARPLEQLEMF